MSSKGGHSSGKVSSKPSQQLRKLLRAHLQKGREASVACCMWALAIAEGSSPNTQLQLLSDGLLDVLCDSVSRVLLVCCVHDLPSVGLQAAWCLIADVPSYSSSCTPVHALPDVLVYAVLFTLVLCRNLHQSRLRMCSHRWQSSWHSRPTLPSLLVHFKASQFYAALPQRPQRPTQWSLSWQCWRPFSGFAQKQETGLCTRTCAR